MSARISFAALAAYPLLDETAPGGIGGAEVRAVTFARGLQRISNHQIEFIVANRLKLLREASGISIMAYERQRGPSRTVAKLGHSISRRFTKLPPHDVFFKRLDTDLIFCFGVRNDTASIIRSARESGKGTVLFLTSDRNIQDAKRSGRRDRGAYGELGYLCRYAMVTADRVVVQTPFQQQELRACLNIDSELIRNPIELEGQGPSDRPKSEQPTALWVGRADTFSKRADICVELAARCSNVHFVMIVNNHDNTVFNQIKQHTSSNVEIIDRVRFTDIESYFQRASLLVNTSSAEGFPNSFLQAGKYGKPIVSLVVDPAEMLTSAACGVCCYGDREQMVHEVNRLSQMDSNYDAISRNIRRYVVSHHGAEVCSRQLNILVNNLAAARTSKVA